MTVAEAQDTLQPTQEPAGQRIDDQVPWTMLFGATLAALLVRTLMLIDLQSAPSVSLSVLWAAVLFLATAAALRFAATRDDVGTRHLSDTLVLAAAVGAFAWMFPHFGGGTVDGFAQQFGVTLIGAGAGGLVGAIIVVTSTRSRATVATAAFVASAVLLLATSLLFQYDHFLEGLVIAIGAEAFALFGRREPAVDASAIPSDTLRAPRSFVSLLTAIVALLGVQQAFAKNVWSDNVPAIVVLGVMFAAALISVTDSTRQMQRESELKDLTGDDLLLSEPAPLSHPAPEPAPLSVGVAPAAPSGSFDRPAVAAPAETFTRPPVATGATAAPFGATPTGAAQGSGLGFGGTQTDPSPSSAQMFGPGASTPAASTAVPSLETLISGVPPIAASWLVEGEVALDVAAVGAPAPKRDAEFLATVRSAEASSSGGFFGAAIDEMLTQRGQSSDRNNAATNDASSTEVPDVKWGAKTTKIVIDVDEAKDSDATDSPASPEPARSQEPAMTDTATESPTKQSDPFLNKPGGFMAIPRSGADAASHGPKGSALDSVAEGLATYKAATAWTHNGVMLGGNAEFWSLIERSPVADFQLLSVVHPDDRPLLAQAISRGTRTGASNRLTLRFLPNPSRGVIWVRGVGGTYQSDVGPLGEVPNASWQLSFAPTDPVTDPEHDARLSSYDLETGLLDQRYLQYWLDEHDPESKREADQPLLLVIEASDPRAYETAPLRERRSVMSEMASAILEAIRGSDIVVRLPGPYLVIIAENIPAGDEWPVMSRFMPLTDTPISELQELLTELPAHASRVVPMRVQDGTTVADIEAMMAQTLDP